MLQSSTLRSPAAGPGTSYLDQFQSRFPDAIIEARQRGRLRTSVLEAQGPSGDWSVPSAPDLTLVRIETAACPVSVDMGHGRFRACLQRHSLVLFPPDVQTSTLVESDHRVTIVSFPYRTLMAMAGDDCGLPPDGDFRHLHSDGFVDRRVNDLFERLVEETRMDQPYGALLSDGLSLEIAAHLLRLRTDRSVPVSGGLAPWQKRRCHDYLAAHLARDVQIAELADLSRLSPFHFARMFKRSMGLPPHAYHRRLRCQRAQELLLGDLSISDVAAAVGYETPQTFARMFRAEVGNSPSNWRRQRRT